MLDNLSSDSEGEIEEIGTKWNSLREGNERRPERADSVSKDKIHSSLYAWNPDRDDLSTVRHLLNHTKDVYLEEIGRKKYEEAYSETIHKLKRREKLRGKEVL